MELRWIGYGVLCGLSLGVSSTAWSQSDVVTEVPPVVEQPVAVAEAPEEETPSALDAALVCLARGDLRCARAGLRRVAESERSSEAAYYWSVSERLAGQSVEAAVVVQRILDGEFGELEAPQVARLRQLRSALEGEIGRLRLGVDGPTAASLFVDGNARGEVNDAVVLLNPGRRVLLLEAPRYEPSRHDLQVELGQELRLDVTMDEVADIPLRRRGAFWAVLTVSIVVVGAATAGLIYAFTTEASPAHAPPFRLDEL